MGSQGNMGSMPWINTCSQSWAAPSRQYICQFLVMFTQS